MSTTHAHHYASTGRLRYLLAGALLGVVAVLGVAPLIPIFVGSTLITTHAADHVVDIALVEDGERAVRLRPLRDVFVMTRSTADAEERLDVIVRSHRPVLPGAEPVVWTRATTVVRTSHWWSGVLHLSVFELPPLDWRLERFVTGKRGIAGAISSRNVAVVVPAFTRRSEDPAIEEIGGDAACVLPTDAPLCAELAGSSLVDGLRVFTREAGAPFRILPLCHREPVPPSALARRLALLDAGPDAPIATIGGYTSTATFEIMHGCAGSGRAEGPSFAQDGQSRCGPVLALSSAVGLHGGAVKSFADRWLFRGTSDNRQRASTLRSLLESDFVQDVVVVYEDDSDAPADEGEPQGHERRVSYAVDQAEQLEDAFRRGGVRLLEAGPGIAATWYSFQRRREALHFREGPPSSRRKPLEGVTSFDELFRARVRDAARDPKKALIFVGRDGDIVRFGRALHAHATEPATPRDAMPARARWYVPGPRELFEHDWSRCAEKPYLSALEGVRVVTADDGNAGSHAFMFARAWSRHWSGADDDRVHQRAPARAARMYDLLSVLARAIDEVDRETFNERAPERVDLMDLDLYRSRVRDAISAMHHEGASGLIDFDARGDLRSGSYVWELRDGKLVPLAAFER